MDGECEEMYRWASQIQRSLQNAVPVLDRARKSCDLVRGLARKGKNEAALALRNKVESQIWQALGACVDPTKSNEEKVELGRRIFLPKDGPRDIANKTAGRPEAWNSIIRGQDMRQARERIEALAHEVAKSGNLLIKSEKVIEHLAEKGWSSVRIATVWGEYLDEVFKPGVKLKMKQEAIGNLMDFVRSMEPKAVIEVDSDLGTMDEAQLRALQGQLLRGLIGDDAKE